MSREDSDGSARSLPRIDPDALPLRIVCGCGRVIELWMTATASADARIKASDVHVERGDPRAILTPLEGRVLALVAQGYSDQEIAHLLSISVHSVKHAVRSSLVRLGARNRMEAAVRALVDGQLPAATIATSGTDGSHERSDALDAAGPAIHHAGVAGSRVPRKE